MKSMASPREEGDIYDMETEKALYAQLYPKEIPPDGIGYDPESGLANKPELQFLLDQSRSEEKKKELEKESQQEEPKKETSPGITPGLASVLGASASLLRTSGYQDTPLSLAQRLGYAIPAGMEAYYKQGTYNQEAEEAQRTADIARSKAESQSEDRDAFRLALTTSGLDPGWFSIVMGVYNNDAKNGWDTLKAKIDKNKKRKDVTYKSKKQLEEEQNPIASEIPEGGYLMITKDGTETPVGKDKQPLNKDKLSTWAKPFKLGANWVQQEIMPNGEKGKIQVIGSLSKKTDKGTEIRAMKGSELQQQGFEVANPDMYYEVTGKDQDADGQYTGNEILTFKQLEDAKIVLNAELDLLGTWGMGSDEAKLILKNRGIQLQPDILNHPDKDRFRVEAKTDKHGNYTVKVLTPLGAELFEDFKEGEIAKRHAATLEQRNTHWYNDNEFRQTKFNEFLVQQAKENKWKKDDIDRAIEIHTLRKKQMEKNLKKGYDYFTRERFLGTELGKKLGTLDPNIVSVEKGPEGKLRFLDGSGMPYQESHKIIKVFDDSTNRTHNHLIDKNGVFKKDLGPTEAEQLTTVERLKYNQEIEQESARRDVFERLVTRLGVPIEEGGYGVDDKILTNLRLRGSADLESALKEVNNIYDREREKDGSLVSGAELKKRFGKDSPFDLEETYTFDGSKYVLARPDQKEYTQTRQLMNDWESLTRDQQVAARGYNGIMNGLRQGNGAGDIMAITTFRIMFEPNSVVRETEFAITEQAQGVFNRATTWLEKLKEGDKLSPEGRRTMFKLATEYMQGAAEWVQSRYVQYSNIAKRYRFDPELTVVHPFDPWKNSWAKRFVTNRTDPDIKADLKIGDEKFPNAGQKNAKPGAKVNPKTGKINEKKRSDEENAELDANNAKLNLTLAPTNK